MKQSILLTCKDKYMSKLYKNVYARLSRRIFDNCKETNFFETTFIDIIVLIIKQQLRTKCQRI